MGEGSVEEMEQELASEVEDALVEEYYTDEG